MIIIEVSDAIRRIILDEGMDPRSYWNEKLWKKFIKCRCDENDKRYCQCCDYHEILPKEIKRKGYTLHLHAKNAIKQIRHDCETSYEFHQWINPDFKPVKDWKEENQWEKVEAFGCTTKLLENPAIYDMKVRNISLGLNFIRKPDLLRTVCMANSALSFTENVIEKAAKRMEIINTILVKATRGFLLPIFVATDGGQKSDEAKGNNRAIAAAVICIPDIRGMSDEEVRELSVDDLLKLKLIPVIARVSIPPEEIGNTKSSCAQAELRALNLAMEMTPTNCPKTTIMDSSGVRGQGLKTRDERDQIPLRRKIRGLYSGAGKGDSRRLEINF